MNFKTKKHLIAENAKLKKELKIALQNVHILNDAIETAKESMTKIIGRRDG